jgi:hypothetical protein
MVGSISPNPIVAFAGGVASHLIADAIPHLDSRSFRDKTTREEIWRADIIVGGIDAIIAIALAVYVTTHGVSPTVWFGGFGGVFPDLMEAPWYLYFRQRYKWLHHLSTWHGKAHFDKTKFKKNRLWVHAGAWSQVVLVAAAWFYFSNAPITKTGDEPVAVSTVRTHQELRLEQPR